MTSDVKKDVTTYQAQRVTLTSPEPLKATLAALMDELNKDKAGMVVFEIMAKSRSKEEIERRIGELTEGKRDFLYVEQTLSSESPLADPTWYRQTVCRRTAFAMVEQVPRQHPRVVPDHFGQSAHREDVRALRHTGGVVCPAQDSAGGDL